MESWLDSTLQGLQILKNLLLHNARLFVRVCLVHGHDKICVFVPCDVKVVDPYFRTLLFHGLESDWMEEECNDEVFRDQHNH